jgi:phenylalanine-4-hydroxylase
MSPYDLSAYKIREGEWVVLDFEGGVQVAGEVITGQRTLQGIIRLISFKNCTVTCQGEVVFSPEKGIYHLAVGSEVVSAYAGPADVDSFELDTHQLSDYHNNIDKNPKRQALENYYAEVRQMRENSTIDTTRLQVISQVLAQEYPSDWLLSQEINELTHPIPHDHAHLP